MQPVTFNGQSVKPGKVVCIGKNYAAHIAEMASVPADDMVVFMKPSTAIGQKLISVMDEPLHYEGEICFMVRAGALHAVGFGLDLTQRELQSKLKSKVAACSQFSLRVGSFRSWNCQCGRIPKR